MAASACMSCWCSWGAAASRARWLRAASNAAGSCSTASRRACSWPAWRAPSRRMTFPPTGGGFSANADRPDCSHVCLDALQFFAPRLVAGDSHFNLFLFAAQSLSLISGRFKRFQLRDQIFFSDSSPRLALNSASLPASVPSPRPAIFLDVL